MHARLLILLAVSAPALAFARGALRDAKDALRDAKDLVEDSDARCARPLRPKLEALEDEVRDVGRGDTSAKRALSKTRDLRDWVDNECRGKLARSVGDQLDAVADALKDARDDDRDDDDRDDRRRRDRDRDRDRDERRQVRRDCGTGDDPGCNLTVGGQSPMDAQAFQGFLASLKSNPNELTKVDIVRQVTRSSYLTAKQLGPVLDNFRNELLRLDAARAAAPHVVDRSHALGHASKWRNSLLASDYTTVMTR